MIMKTHLFGYQVTTNFAKQKTKCVNYIYLHTIFMGVFDMNEAKNLEVHRVLIGAQWSRGFLAHIVLPHLPSSTTDQQQKLNVSW